MMPGQATGLGYVDDGAENGFTRSPRRTPAEWAHRMPPGATRELPLYIGSGTKIHLLPLRHRDQVSFDITALCADDTWAPKVTKDGLLATVNGLDERLVNITSDLDRHLSRSPTRWRCCAGAPGCSRSPPS